MLGNQATKTTHLIHNSRLLLQRHSNRILMTIPVQTNFMARIGYHATLLGERLERVARDEPGRFDVVALEHG